MSAPIDDERVRSAADHLRAIAFATVSAMLAAPLVWISVAWIDPPPHSAFAWVAACATCLLAWWAVPRRPSDVAAVFARPAIAGAIDGVVCAVTLLAFLAARGADSLPAPPSDVLGLALGALIVGVTLAGAVGLMIGAVFGAGLTILWYVLEDLEQRVLHTTPPWAVFVTAVWSAAGFGLAALLGVVLPGASIVGGVLAGVSVLVAIAACTEVLRRRRFAAQAERGELAGWRVERDADGTRWLVREERGGNGAYREGVVSRRWARVSG